MYIHINSEHLYLTEPLMAKYYDFHSTMLLDEIKHCVEIPHDLILINVRDWLKDMIKRGYAHRWDLPWRKAFSNIQGKQTETFAEKLNIFFNFQIYTIKFFIDRTTKLSLQPFELYFISH